MGECYAQVGYIKHGNNAATYFWEYAKGDQYEAHSNEWGSPQMDDFHTFRVKRVYNPSNCHSTNDCLVMTVGGSAGPCNSEPSGEFCP